MFRVHLFRLAHTNEQVDRDGAKCIKGDTQSQAQYTCKFHHAQDAQPSAFRSDKPMVKLLHPLSLTSSCPGARSDPSDPQKEKQQPRGRQWRQSYPKWKLEGSGEGSGELGTGRGDHHSCWSAAVSFSHFPGFQLSASDNCSPSSGQISLDGAEVLLPNHQSTLPQRQRIGSHLLLPCQHTQLGGVGDSTF